MQNGPSFAWAMCSTSVNVFFNNDDNYCDNYGCTVSGWVNEYVVGKDSLSLCEVQATGEEFYSEEDFDTWIPLTFELPEVSWAWEWR